MGKMELLGRSREVKLFRHGQKCVKNWGTQAGPPSRIGAGASSRLPPGLATLWFWLKGEWEQMRHPLPRQAG